MGTTAPNDSAFPPLTRSTVLACAVQSWLPRFRRCTPKTTVIALPPDFFDYLDADGIFIPDGSAPAALEGQVSELSDSDDDAAGSDGSSVGDAPSFAFPEIDARIREVIERYGGAVFPKLSWSSPQDAAWMNAGPPLQCRAPSDVYLLLKASDFVLHDLDHAYDGCVDAPAKADRSDICLILKQWFDMPRSNEFRCFVRSRRLIAISQRDFNFYAFLNDDALRATILESIMTSFDRDVLPGFEEIDFVFDVYLTRDFSRVFIVDFAPIAPRTDPLLFDWFELHDLATTPPSTPVFRVVPSEVAASQSAPRFSHNRMPRDVVELSDGASIAEFARNYASALGDAVRDADAVKVPVEAMGKVSLDGPER